MTARRTCGGGLATALCALCSAAEPPASGLWLTPAMWTGVAHRAADALAARYDFDDDQRYLTRELFGRRLATWATAHRADLQPVANEYFEMLWSDRPPATDDLAAWAARAHAALPVVDELITDCTEDMRGYLTAAQQARLDQDLSVIVGPRLELERRLQAWRVGDYDPARDWRVAGGATGSATETLPPDAEIRLSEIKPEQRLAVRRYFATEADFEDSWVAYVAAFAAHYQLTDEQRWQAERLLARLADSRDHYLLRKGPKLDAVEARIAAAELEDEARQWMKRYNDLVRPLDTKFQLLRERLHHLPSRRQIRAAADQPALREPPSLVMELPARP